MVHNRINEKESNPNIHINFITALPAQDDTEQEAARQLLRALAAQVRPIMKSHGFSINSFEEYEHNNVFAGRNWNAGETIELVLRRADKTFLPIFWLMSTFCHELAHIKHMNHGSAFQASWRQLQQEVRDLQDEGYYGDGYWSSGTRLGDSFRVGGQGIEPGDLPEYMCGGAHTRKRPTAVTRRRARQPRDSTSIASSKTGRQTAKPRKAGTRVTSKTAFLGKGMTLAEEGVRGQGIGFGKRATSKRARDERAWAAEKRMLALQNRVEASTSKSTLDVAARTALETELDDNEDDIVPETDSQRRHILLSSEGSQYLQGLQSGTLWGYLQKDFDLKQASSSRPANVDHTGDLPSQSESTGGSGKRQEKKRDVAKVVKHASSFKHPVTATSLGIGKIVQSEMDLRRRESLGMQGGRALGSRDNDRSWDSGSKLSTMCEKDLDRHEWACHACTLYNQPEHLACSACATPRTSDQQAQLQNVPEA